MTALECKRCSLCEHRSLCERCLHPVFNSVKIFLSRWDNGWDERDIAGKGDGYFLSFHWRLKQINWVIDNAKRGLDFFLEPRKNIRSINRRAYRPVPWNHRNQWGCPGSARRRRTSVWSRPCKRTEDIRTGDPLETKPVFQNSDSSFYIDIHRSASFFPPLEKCFIDGSGRLVKIKPRR